MKEGIIQQFNDMEKEIYTEEVKKHLQFLDAPYPELKAAALKNLERLNYDLNNNIIDLINDPSERVRTAAYKFISKKMNTLDEEKKRRFLFKKFNDFSHKLRKAAINEIISNEYLTDEIKDKAIKDSSGSVRYEFLKKYVELYPEEKEKISNIFKDDPYTYIQKFIKGIKDIRSILLSSASAKIKTDSLFLFLENSDSEKLFKVISDTFFKVNKTTKMTLIKFFKFLQQDDLVGFCKKIIKNESDSDVLDKIARILLKIEIKALDDELANYLESKDPKLIKLFFFVNKKKDNMNYVENAREFMKVNDDDIILSAGDYLLHYQDYELTQYVHDFLNSKDSKRIAFAIKIIKKLKLENMIPELAEIVANNMYSATIRKAALKTIKMFKGKNFIFVAEDILKNKKENHGLRKEALHTLLKLNAERFTQVYEELHSEEKENAQEVANA
jgi:hypothetical protein